MCSVCSAVKVAGEGVWEREPPSECMGDALSEPGKEYRKYQLLIRQREDEIHALWWNVRLRGCFYYDLYQRRRLKT